MRVSGDVYLLAGDGANIAVQVGPQGAFVVDTGSGKLSDKVMAAISQAQREADPVHRQHDVPSRPYRRQRRSCRLPVPIPA